MAQRRIVDLSVFLENDVLSDPPPLAPRIEYQAHKETVGEFQHLYPGTSPSDYPDGEAAAAEKLFVTTHNGTHLDAPWHYHSTMDAKLGGPRRVDDHRRSATRLVFSAGRETGFPPF